MGELVKPIAGTAWCEAPHFQYQLSVHIHVKMEDGSEFETGPGAVVCLPKGHDAGLWATSRSSSSIGTVPRIARSDDPRPAIARLR